MVPGRRVARIAGEVVSEYRYGEMTVKRPRKRPVTGNAASVTVRVVDVREIAPPDGEPPIHWRLLTSHDVASVEQALRIVGWYQARWQVEQLFRTLKRQGLDIESSQVETAGGLMKLSLAALHSAAIVLQLVQARDGTDPRPATDAWCSPCVACRRRPDRRSNRDRCCVTAARTC